MKGLISWFARNSVVANLLLLVIAFGGIITLTDLKQEVFPEISLETIIISADYRGAAPEEVEEAICLRIEEAIQAIEGIKKITSTANEGAGRGRGGSEFGLRRQESPGRDQVPSRRDRHVPR